MSKKKNAEAAADTADLIIKMKEHLDNIERQRAAAEKIKDPGEKILALYNLQRDIWRSVKPEIERKIKKLAKKRGAASARTYIKRASLALGSLTVIGAIVPLMIAAESMPDDPRFTSRKSMEKEEAALLAVPDISLLNDKIKAHQHDISRLYEETVMHCDLRTLSESPYFSKVHKDHEDIRARFDAAAAARAALGEEAAPPKKSASQAGDKIAHAGNYDHLKKGLS